MHQQRQHIVFAGESGHIVAECTGVDLYTLASKHSDHSILQTIHIHLDVNFQGFVGFSLVPVGAELVPQHGFHNRFRTVHGIVRIAGLPVGNQIIAIVPRSGFLKVHLILVAESSHFLFGETKVFCQITGVGHGILREHIQRRMGAILFNRKDARHIGQRNIVLILEPRPQEIEVLFLRILILLIFTEQAVPFIDQDHKRPFRFCVDVLHHLNEVSLIPKTHFLKMVGQVKDQILLQHGQHFIHAVRHAQKFLHIDLEDIVLVPMLLIRTCLADFQRVKQGCGIFTTVVVSCKHIRSHRLAEASGAADADELLPGIDDSVRLFDQPGLVHIDLRVQAFLKALAARIQITAHAGTSHRANIIMFIIL